MSSTDSVTTPVVPVTLWDCACLSVVLVSVFTAVRVGVRIRLYGPAIVLSLSVVLVLVCLCADTPKWARIAFSLSLVGGLRGF